MTEAWVQSLFDEEPEVYGPKGPKPWGPRHYYGSAEKGVGNQTKSTDKGEHRLIEGNPLGAPPLDWWNVSEEEVHRRLNLAMCPERVCRTCGEPSRRILGEARYVKPDGREAKKLGMRVGTRAAPGVNQWLVPGYDTGNYRAVRDTVGWTDCGHDDWRPGVVLDPFAGSGAA